ncbi:MAG: hypothetical protein KGJ86_13710, partial [Chloroflexota bacterium]|nr:hypothetical protein [Chloroflexota bacterium]
RQRLETRHRDIPGWHELTWADVEKVKANYEPWTDHRLVVDAMSRIDKNLAKLKRYLGGEGLTSATH